MKDRFFGAQDRQKDNADKSQKAHLVINIEDKVWLLCHNLGSFLIIKQINDVEFV
jgi:hypothetical protein